MNSVRVTVCIPAYNQPGFLHEALASLCDQGLRRDEYVVAISDDASSTPLRKVVSAFETKLQIVYDRSETNVGHIANFERAGQLATTPYISFLPHDDLVAPGQLGRALSTIESNRGAVLVSSLVLCQRYPGAVETKPHGIFLGGSSTASYAEPYLWHRTAWLALALATTPLSIVGSVFHAATFAKCQLWKRFPLWHDRLMLAEMGFHGAVISLPWIGGYYRVSGGQLSGRLWETDRREFLEVSQLILDLCRASNLPVIDFWIDQICAATPDERILYLQMLDMALTGEVFQSIKRESEKRLQMRLHLGGRLDRLGVPRPIARFLRVCDRFLTGRHA